MADDDEPVAGGDDSTSDDDGYEDPQVEREAHYPEVGYNVVEINLMRPPGNALSLVSHQLKLSAVSLRPQTEFEDYVVYDQYGNAYDHDDIESEPVIGDVDALIETVKTGDDREQRLALLGLTKLTEDDPESCFDAVPLLSERLDDADLAVQAEVLTIFANISQDHPDQVTPTIELVQDFLTTTTPPELLEDVIRIVAAVAEPSPGAVVDAPPRLAAVLQEGSTADAAAITALQRIADAYPDAVVPVATQLIEYLEDGDEMHLIGAIAVLGTLSKEYPNVAAETIPKAIELVTASNHKLRANSAGLLADLADEYPEQVRPIVPEAIALLDDPDDKARYNATSILARIAKEYPDAVAAAVEPLIDALDEEFEYARSNACWALGYLEAEQALDRLEELEATDSSEDVRSAAKFAIQQIRSG